MESKQDSERIESHILVTKPPTFHLLSKMKRKRLVMGGGS